MKKISEKRLGEMAESFLEALDEGLADEDLRRSPSFLSFCYKFFKELGMEFSTDNKKVRDTAQGIINLPVFTDYDKSPESGGVVQDAPEENNRRAAS